MQEGDLLTRTLDIRSKPSAASVIANTIFCGYCGTSIKKLQKECDLSRASLRLQNVVDSVLLFSPEEEYQKNFENCSKAVQKFNALVEKVNEKKEPHLRYGNEGKAKATIPSNFMDRFIKKEESASFEQKTSVKMLISLTPPKESPFRTFNSPFSSVSSPATASLESEIEETYDDDDEEQQLYCDEEIEVTPVKLKQIQEEKEVVQENEENIQQEQEEEVVRYPSIPTLEVKSEFTLEETVQIENPNAAVPEAISRKVEVSQSEEQVDNDTHVYDSKEQISEERVTPEIKEEASQPSSSEIVQTVITANPEQGEDTHTVTQIEEAQTPTTQRRRRRQHTTVTNMGTPDAHNLRESTKHSAGTFKKFL